MKVEDINDLTNLTVVLNRLIQVDGEIEIVRKKVPLGGEVLIQDVHEKSRLFKPIAVIHHSGEVFQNSTRGHYQADVLNKTSQQWYRTSDDEAPVRISKEGITKEGYIFLYKRL